MGEFNAPARPPQQAGVDTLQGGKKRSTSNTVAEQDEVLSGLDECLWAQPCFAFFRRLRSSFSAWPTSALTRSAAARASVTRVEQKPCLISPA